MFQPLEGFIGLRYLFSGRKRGVVSFITAASFLGLALGVTALIVILSVLNGFETENRTRLLSMSEHIAVLAPGATGGAATPAEPGLADANALAARLAAERGVTGVSPFVELEGMLTAGRELRPAIVRGIVPAREAAATPITELVAPELLAGLTPGSGRVILGRLLALNLGVDVGDRVNLWLPKLERGRASVRPASFVVAGIFEAGVQDHDANLALTSLDEASRLKGLGGRPEGLAVRLDDPLDAPAVTRRLRSELGDALTVSSWTEKHRSLFRAMHIEKTMMTIILMFIVGVAAFNIVTSLMMVVTEKERDIAILRTCGLEPARVVRIFFVQGAVIGLLGTVLGMALGLVLAFNVGTIVPWLEATFHFKIMPGDVFYVSEIPSEVHLGDVIAIPGLAFAIAMLATVFPSRRAARVAPAHALRYE